MFADVTDYVYSVNGTSYCPAMSTVACSNFGGLAAVPGLVSTLDLSAGGTGLGSLTLTYNPGPGTYHVDFWLFEQLQQPGFNEYGATGGSPAAGQSWQIDVPDYDYTSGSGDPNFGGLPAGAGTIIANTLADTLTNTNYLTGSTDQYNLTCKGLSTCNDYASMAMGFNFTLDPGDKGIITFKVSTTKPTSGFYLEQIHPVDGANPTETDYFLTSSATISSGGPPPPSVPEPGSAVLVGLSVALVFSPAARRRIRKWVG
jgi:hypothetical protein